MVQAGTMRDPGEAEARGAAGRMSRGTMSRRHDDRDLLEAQAG
jgi:hypothetical protein